MTQPPATRAKADPPGARPRRTGWALVLRMVPVAAFAALLAIPAAAQDVPVPRISPVKDPASAAAAPPILDDPTVAGDDSAPDAAAAPGDSDLHLVRPEDIPDPSRGVGVGLTGEGLGEGAFDAPMALGPGAAPLPEAPMPSGPIDLTSPPAGLDGAAPTDPAAGLSTLTLEARLTEGGTPISSGMTWRVYGGEVGADGKMRLVGEATGGPVTLKLRAGSYYVHASYGRAGVSKKVQVGGTVDTESVILNAGGMRLTALAGKELPLPNGEVNFDIYAPDEGGSDERILLVSNAPAGKIIALSAGIYHVVCRYGDANAVVRADIRVEPGKLVDAAVYQNAARLTLKLVEAHGGEALANTQWSVLTPSGDKVTDSVGAFPSVVLAAGEYTAIAKHNDKVYERSFTVEPGVNRDVEVLLNP